MLRKQKFVKSVLPVTNQALLVFVYSRHFESGPARPKRSAQEGHHYHHPHLERLAVRPVQELLGTSGFICHHCYVQFICRRDLVSDSCWQAGNDDPTPPSN